VWNFTSSTIRLHGVLFMRRDFIFILSLH
jgi:hypothetical protein